MIHDILDYKEECLGNFGEPGCSPILENQDLKRGGMHLLRENDVAAPYSQTTASVVAILATTSLGLSVAGLLVSS